MTDDHPAPAPVLELKPPRLPAQMALFIAVGSALMALGGLATGEVLLGVVALVSAAWLASMAYVSLTGWTRADDDGVAARWIRSTAQVRWDEVAEIRIDRRGPNATLRAVLVVCDDETAFRWAPWFPFLSYTYHSVSVSLDALTARAQARGVPVEVLSPPPRPTADPGA